MNDELGDLPVNFHFADQRTVAVDIDAVMRRGVRMRRRRWALGAGSPAVLLGLIGVCAATLAPGAGPHAVAAAGSPVNAFEQTSIVKQYPPAGGHVTVLAVKAGAHHTSLSVLAWTSGTTVCAGAGDLAVADGSGTNVGCSGFPVGFEDGGKPTEVPYGFVPQTDANGNVPYIGFVHGTVSKVSLDFKGRDYQAEIVPLPDGSSIGAYVVWLPWTTPSISGKDISGFTAYGPSGLPVAIQMY